MTDDKFDLLPLLDYIDPSKLSYQDWVNVGFALKHEGYTAMDWDIWSQSDSRYKKGECFAKWDSFQGNGLGTVTGATITQLAKEKAITQLAVIIAIIVLYFPLAVIALILAPFIGEDDRWHF